MTLTTKYCHLVLVVFFCSASSIHAYAQNKIQIGIEHDVYPAGKIPGLIVGTTGMYKYTWNYRVAVNLARRKDYSGLNDDERGWGPGVSIGLRYYPNMRKTGWFGGLRSDLWYMSINWIDHSEPIDRGVTKIWVVQPTFELGYVFELNENWNLGLAFTNGVEVNVITKGEEVGQGWITLGAVRLTRKFNL